MSITFAVVICDAMNLALGILRMILNHLSQCHLGAQLALCIFEIVVPTPNSWDDRDPFTTQNVLLLPSFLASATTSLFFDFRQLPCRYFLGFSPFFVHCCFRIWFFIALGKVINLCTWLQWLTELIRFTAVWSSWSLCCRVPSKRFLVDSWASTMRAYLVSGVSGLRQVSLYVHLLILQGIAAGIGTSNFLGRFFSKIIK